MTKQYTAWRQFLAWVGLIALFSIVVVFILLATGEVESICLTKTI